MNSDWQTFLESRAFNPGEDGVLQPPASEQTLVENGLCDLSHLGLMELTGEDTGKFLQGQLTADVNQVDEQHWRVAGYCTPKGRMLASFSVSRLGEATLLQMPAATQAPLMKRFPMFVMMSKVKVRDPAADISAFGCWGERAASALAERFSLPASFGDASSDGHVSLLRMAGEPARFTLIGATERLQELWQQLESTTTAASYDQWRLLDIRGGFPVVFEQTVEAFVPQMVNLQRIEGVSFTKGCFVGQEVVARMKYLGKIKRRMYLAHGNTDQRPQPGDELFAPSSTSGQGAGKVVDAAPSPQGGFELLVVAEIAAVEGDTLHLRDLNGPTLSLSAPAYGFDEN